MKTKRAGAGVPPPADRPASNPKALRTPDSRLAQSNAPGLAGESTASPEGQPGLADLEVREGLTLRARSDNSALILPLRLQARRLANQSGLSSVSLLEDACLAEANGSGGWGNNL
jgi:hypothetical protein